MPITTKATDVASNCKRLKSVWAPGHAKKCKVDGNDGMEEVQDDVMDQVHYDDGDGLEEEQEAYGANDSFMARRALASLRAKRVS